jgi:hypothetical protein
MEQPPARKTPRATPAGSGRAPTGTTSATVTASLSFVAGETRTEPLDGELLFDPADPYAVTMRLEASTGTVIWAFARQLLADGIYEPTGDGDVQVWPCLNAAGEAVVIIELSSPSGLAMLQAPSRTVQDFVRRTIEVLPLGQESEHLALDALISRLLAD